MAMGTPKRLWCIQRWSMTRGITAMRMPVRRYDWMKKFLILHTSVQWRAESYVEIYGNHTEHLLQSSHQAKISGLGISDSFNWVHIPLKHVTFFNTCIHNFGHINELFFLLQFFLTQGEKGNSERITCDKETMKLLKVSKFHENPFNLSRSFQKV